MAKDDDNLENPEFSGGKINAGEAGAGVPTPEDLRERAEELAEIDGLRPEDVDNRYLAQARQELMGNEIGSADVMSLADDLEERDDMPGASGRHIPNMAVGDDNVAEKLVAEGMDEALHDEMRQASRSLDRQERGLETDDTADFE